MKRILPKFLFSQEYITFDHLKIPYIVDYTLDHEWYFIEMYKLTRIPEEYWK